MRKMVNGKVVDIKNIELFEKGFEGIILNKTVSSSVKDTLNSESELVKSCVEAYNTVINSLPFPLFAIESNCKYALIADYILSKVPELTERDIYVDNGIVINIDRDTVLRLVFKTWAIEKRQNKQTVKFSSDIYKDESEYVEMKWCIDKMIAGQPIRSYYTEFMGDFIKACNEKSMVLNWELNHILDFGYVPDELEIEDNRIINIDTDYEYFVDIFCTGKVKSDDTVLEYVSRPGGNSKFTYKNKLVKAYDFDVYGKQLKGGHLYKDENNKLEKKQLTCMAYVFNEVLHYGISDDNIDRVKYHGIIVGDELIFEVDGRLYRCSSVEYTGSPELIASKIQLYGYENGKVYIKNTQRLESGVYKDNIFAYDLGTKKARLCKTSFRAKEKDKHVK